MSFPEVLGVYDIALHSYGKERMIGSAHIEIPEELKVAWIDNLQRAITHKVFEDTGVEMMGVSVYAVNSKRSASEEIRGKIAEIVSEFSEVISMHGFYIDITDRAIRFDVVTDFGIKSRGELAERIKNRVEKEYPDYEIEVHVDYALTDQQLT
jgi:divalent metal cation (Fe/Co/Zn/Cd) transporter